MASSDTPIRGRSASARATERQRAKKGEEGVGLKWQRKGRKQQKREQRKQMKKRLTSQVLVTSIPIKITYKAYPAVTPVELVRKMGLSMSA
jgi:hypothetical protein